MYVDNESPVMVLADHGPSPEALAISHIDDVKMKSQLADIVSELPEREQVIIRARLLCDAKFDLAAVGHQLGGLSRERVRQIGVGALRKLRVGLTNRGFGLGDGRLIEGEEISDCIARDILVTFFTTRRLRGPVFSPRYSLAGVH
jgi:hypothetical protein